MLPQVNRPKKCQKPPILPFFTIIAADILLFVTAVQSFIKSVRF